MSRVRKKKSLSPTIIPTIILFIVAYGVIMYWLGFGAGQHSVYKKATDGTSIMDIYKGDK